MDAMGFMCSFENVLLCHSKEFHSDFNTEIHVYISDSCAALICGVGKSIFSNLLIEIFF